MAKSTVFFCSCFCVLHGYWPWSFWELLLSLSPLSCRGAGIVHPCSWIWLFTWFPEIELTSWGLHKCLDQQSRLCGSTSPFVSSFFAGKTGTILFRLHHEPENNFAIWQRQLTAVSWTPSLHATWETTTSPLAADTIEVSIWKGLWFPGIYHEGALRDKAIVHGDSYANKLLVFWMGVRGQEFSMFPLMCRLQSRVCELPPWAGCSRTSQAHFPVKWGLCWPLTQALMFLPTLIELQEQSGWLPAWSELVSPHQRNWIFISVVLVPSLMF